MSRLVGGGGMVDPKAIEDAMVEAMECGCRMIALADFTSDLALKGASSLAEPFFRAAERCGFSRLEASGQASVAARFAKAVSAAGGVGGRASAL